MESSVSVGCKPSAAAVAAAAAAQFAALSWLRLLLDLWPMCEVRFVVHGSLRLDLTLAMLFLRPGSGTPCSGPTPSLDLALLTLLLLSRKRGTRCRDIFKGPIGPSSAEHLLADLGGGVSEPLGGRLQHSLIMPSMSRKQREGRRSRRGTLSGVIWREGSSPACSESCSSTVGSTQTSFWRSTASSTSSCRSIPSSCMISSRIGLQIRLEAVIAVKLASAVGRMIE
mmetsp:Transcript_115364/g.337294  ORF Transcript_115364/g.337294 Transcript_115364/m.337294 type:complete len:226 (-) Transcript_115364:1711-2388(-)